MTIRLKPSYMEWTPNELANALKNWSGNREQLWAAANMLRQQAQEIKALHNLVKEQDKKIIDLAFDLEYTKQTDEFVKKVSKK